MHFYYVLNLLVQINMGNKLSIMKCDDTGCLPLPFL